MMRPKKSLGQNFLTDKNIIHKILSSFNIKNKHIVEIGPGTGNLTKEILKKKPSHVLLVEKDNHLATKLLKELEKIPIKIDLQNNDILKFDLESVLKSQTIIFGNLPYNISSQILVKFIKFKKWPPRYENLVLMFQKEVGEKIISNANTLNYGRLGILTKSRLEIVDHFDISKNCFFPKPKVESKLIIFKPKIDICHKIKNINNLEKITQLFFSNKRKMINKVLKSIFDNKVDYINLLKIDETKRPAELTESDYFRITELYEKKLNIT